MDEKRVVVAMSGGVDSTTVAALLVKEGWDVIGVTMQLLDYRDAEGGCCSFDHVVDARRAASQLGIPHYVVNFTEEFRTHVLKDYVDKYRSGKTPIPCVLCNKYVKFDLLLGRAMELGARYLATGHYARIAGGEGGYTLRKADDQSKDQTYFLHTLTQKELRKLLFPLGSISKEKVRGIAKELGLIPAEKPDSTGVCFVPGGDYRDYLATQEGFTSETGDIVDREGRVLGRHNGVFSYTIGQRRGLGIATGKPMYVTGIEPSGNRVIVGGEEEIYRTMLVAENITWINNINDNNIIDSTFQVKVKVRYRHPESPATIRMISPTDATVEFERPQRSIAPGQAVVFYDGDNVLGGGWIKEVLRQ